jgi:hypothetical protein
MAAETNAITSRCKERREREKENKNKRRGTYLVDGVCWGSNNLESARVMDGCDGFQVGALPWRTENGSVEEWR